MPRQGPSKKMIAGWQKKLDEHGGNFTQAAAALGVHRQTLRRYCTLPAPKSNDCSVSVNGKEASISLLSDRVVTVADAVAKGGLDTKLWEVDRSLLNQWEVGSKHPKTGHVTVTPLWQVKVWMKLKTPVVTGIELLLERLENHKFKIPVRKHPKRPVGTPHRELEISLVDPHLGLVCYPPGSQDPWDLRRCASVCMATIERAIEQASMYGPFERVILPFGHDFLHVDTVFGTTTSGTGQPEGVAWGHQFLAGETLMIEIVERLRQVAPVKVYMIPGNHARQTEFALGRVLKAWYRQADDVEVDAGMEPYKFHRIGKCLLGMEHGHSITPIRLAALMANECPQGWAETIYREWHLGDQHRSGSAKPSVMEEQGVSVEYLPSLVSNNEWHKLHGFTWQKRGLKAFIWNANGQREAVLYHTLAT